MAGKYEKSVLEYAWQLDSIIDNNGEFTKYAKEIIDNKDENITRLLMMKISILINSSASTKEVRKAAKLLNDSIIGYYGYNCVKKICDSNKEIDELDSRTLNELLEELNSLAGLEKVKEQVNNLITYQTIQKLRRSRGFNSVKGTLHLAFVGNPGTGKTTVARIVGHIYRHIGLLSKGHFVEVSRTDLIAGYQGQTALKVKKVIEDAKGGVLFIDEAYSITENENSDSYGRECLTELTKALEDYRDDLVVIVAGYTEPMIKFFESNPGLKSRFNTFIEFDDYSSDELLAIVKSICNDNCYTLSEGLQTKLESYFRAELEKKDEHFANGRLARNIYDDLVMAHAKRIIGIENPTDEELTTLVVDDLQY